MDKIICSLEDWDSILDYYRPNGSSKTWYIKELRRLTRPLMWGDWDIFSQDGEMFPSDFYKGKVCPVYNKKIEYTPKDKINKSNHIYIINIYNMSFFHENYDIGFTCISEDYLNDVREGRSKILLMLILEGYSGSDGNHDLDIIEKWRIDSQLPENSIFYGTGNQLICGNHKGIVVKSILDFEAWNYKIYNDIVQYHPSEHKNLFLSYNRNPRPHRIYFTILLMKENLLNRGLYSLGNVNYYNSETYIVDETNSKEFEFLKVNTPLLIDSAPDLYYNLACDVTLQDYERTFISIISETLMDRNTLFISEKTWKPIMVGHPFMILGNKNSLVFLKSLGYKTFDKWIDESYDLIDNEKERREAIIKELKKLSELSINQLIEMRKEMNEICEYNQKHFYFLYQKKYGEDNINSEISDLIDEIWQSMR